MKKTDYNDIAKEYVGFQGKFYQTRKDASREKLFSQINFPVKNKKILEIGVGSGDDLNILFKKSALVYGIDISEEMVRIAKKKYPHLQNLMVNSFEKTSFKDKFFDLVISRFTFHYSEDLDRGFKEMYRILKKNGILLFLVPHPLVDFLVKKDKNYEKSEIIKRSVFADSLYLYYPTHTLSEYLSPFILKNFELQSFQEEVNISDKNRETGFLVIKLKKR